MTRTEMAEMQNSDFIILILKTKLIQCYNKNTPMAMKLKKAIRYMEALKRSEFEMNFDDGQGVA